MITFSKRLKEERKAFGLNLKEMAEKLGIPYRTYVNYEQTGKQHREPDFEMLVKIADALDISLDDLFGRKV